MVNSKQYGNKDVMNSNLKFPIPKQNLSARDLLISLSTKHNVVSPKNSVFVRRRNFDVSQTLQCLHSGRNMRSDAAQVK